MDVERVLDNRVLESGEVCILVLNVNGLEDSVVRSLWSRSRVKVCADGGANSLRDKLQDLVPDAIVGDLDSIREDVKEYFQSIGVAVSRVEEQETHDGEKGLIEIERRLGANAKDAVVVVIGALEGRLDHEMANVNMLFTWKERFERLILVSPHSLAILLKEGHSKIIRCQELESPTCGLIPIAGPCTVSTEGLRWNLCNTVMAFGGLISSSNHAESEQVIVQTSAPLIWTSALHSR